MRIVDLPFSERPVLELLHFETDRASVDHDYAGYGWARVPRIHIGSQRNRSLRQIDDALLLALHSSDGAEPLADDVELEFELPDRAVTVLASQFLEQWLPRLPGGSDIVLAMCNPHHATLRLPHARTIWYPAGDVESWIDDNAGGRIELLSDENWATVTS